MPTEGRKTSIDNLLARMEDVDLLLIEGFKSHRHQKMEVFRPSVGKPLLCSDDPTIVAVACDTHLTGINQPVIDLGDIKAIADFIIGHLGLKAGSLKAGDLKAGDLNGAA